jgi:tetratricopeptide (TPR) repeat protein
MRKRPKGRKLSTEVLRVLINLEPAKLYTLAEAVKTVYPRDHALYDVVYRRIANYLDNHFAPDVRDHPYRYYGKTLQSRLSETDRRQVTEPIAMRSTLRTPKFWLFALGIVFFGAAGATMTRLDPFDILNTMGLGAARQAVNAHEAKLPAEIFAQAWVAYLEGNYQDAEAKTFEVLAGDGDNARQKADCYYLLGNIFSESGNARQALSHFEIAYRLYGEAGSIHNLYFVALETARAMIIIGDYERAREMLEEARTHYDTDLAGAHKLPHLGQYYLILKILAVRQHDFKTALSWAILRYQELIGTNSIDEWVGAITDLGFLYTVNGCAEQGIAFSNQAEREIFKLGDEKRWVWCQLNKLMINKSLGFEMDQHTLAFIEDWSKMKGDSELQFQLRLVLDTTPKEYADESCESLSKSVDQQRATNDTRWK